MYERFLRKMRQKVRDRRYVVTTHADDEMYADGLTIWDVEGAVLAGGIIERQRDQWSNAWKYVIRGKSTTGSDMAVVAKIGYTQDLVIITVYLVDS